MLIDIIQKYQLIDNQEKLYQKLSNGSTKLQLIIRKDND